MGNVFYHKLRFLFLIAIIHIMGCQSMLLAQQIKIDSLKKVLTSTLSDEQKVEVMVELCWAYYDNAFDSTSIKALEVVRFADSIGYKKGQVDALNLYSFTLPIKEVLDISSQAYEIAKAIDYKEGQATAKNDIGAYYWEFGDYTKAIENFEDAVELSIEAKDTTNLSNVYINLGNIYQELGNRKLSRSNYQKGYEVSSDKSDPFLQSLHYEIQALVFKDENQLDSAIFYQLQSIEYSLDNKDNYSLAYGYANLGECYLEQKNYKKAEENFLIALDYALLIEDIALQVSLYSLLAETYTFLKEYQKGIEMGNKGLVLIDSDEDLLLSPMLDIMESLGIIYSLNKDFEKSSFYFKESLALKDSLFSFETQEKLAEYETLFKINEKTTENLRLQAEKDIAQTKARTRTILSIGAFIILGLSLILLGVLIMSRSKLKLQTKKLERLNLTISRTNNRLESLNTELQRSNADLKNFASVASHDLQEPLRTIGSFVQLLEMENEEKLDEDSKEYMSLITEAVQRMSTLIQAILTYSKVGKKEFIFKKVRPKAIIDQNIQDLSVKIQERNAEIILQPLPDTIMAEPTQLSIVFYNLINNGIKFNTSEKPAVEIDCQERDGDYLFSIKDNGIGIDPKNHEKIFEIFKRLHRKEEYKGTGIGLASVRRIVEKHGGTIWLESELGKGTTFFFTIQR